MSKDIKIMLSEINESAFAAPRDGQEYNCIKKQYRSSDRKGKFVLDTVFLALCGVSLNDILKRCEE